MSKKLPDELLPVAKFFNWGEISRKFSGTRSVLRATFISDVHEPIITEMVQAVHDVLKKYGIIK
jgi:hypothetical protein